MSSIMRRRNGLMASSVMGILLFWVKVANPRIKRAAFIGNPEIKTYEFYLRAAQSGRSTRH